MRIPASPPRSSAKEPDWLRGAPAARVIGPQGHGYTRGREVLALALWGLAAVWTMALGSYHVVRGTSSTDFVGTRANWVGPVGEALASAAVGSVGFLAWAVPLNLVLLGVPFAQRGKNALTPLRAAGDLLLIALVSALVRLCAPTSHVFGDREASGAVGELLGELLRGAFSTPGAVLMTLSATALVLIARARFSFIALLEQLGWLGATSARKSAEGAAHMASAWRTARAIEKDARAARQAAAEPRIQMTPTPSIAHVYHAPIDPDEGMSLARALSLAPMPDVVFEPLTQSPAPVAVMALSSLPRPQVPAPVHVAEPIVLAAVEPVKAISSQAIHEEREQVPTIVDTSAHAAKERPATVKRSAHRKPTKDEFQLPSIDFLERITTEPMANVDKEQLLKNAELLIKTLGDYGVSGKVEEILPGPTVTTYEVSPAAGTKVSKVASLADDLALALARKVRILAPIPGKNRIGFELPNERRAPVGLRDLVEDARFQGMDVPLPCVLGRDIVGNPVYADLASMPHVIVAGATGAGKSVGLNVMLTSLLYRRTPEDLRMLMIDPKVVELAPFDKIPHLLLPVVTDMKQAANALKWAVDEMERRYQMFADAGTKNLGTYNGWQEKVARGEIKNPNPKMVMGTDHNNLPDMVLAEAGTGEGEAPLPERLPYIVIVIDEFADLMMQNGKDVETSVARLAQKARAAGMHVILATQRPSVDVITGMIKANFPTRIAFRVAQKVDSRTILDEQGAEHLLGRGDMLVKLNGTNDTRRVQCPWVSEDEVQLICDHLRAQGEPVYDENILKPRDEEGAADDEEDEKDAVYDDAVRVVAETRRCSTSWLQRKLGLGYNRAARIVEMMEKRGIIGPANGAKDREVLITAF